MLSGEELLPQGNDMVYIDAYELNGGNVSCQPRFKGIEGKNSVPLHMWIESIGQAGEICLRQTEAPSGKALLINIEGVPYTAIKADEASKYRYCAAVEKRFGKYVRTEIDVLKEEKTEFRCSCIHYLG
ncbi:MAG: hypothetical protein IJ010_00770 [Ruminococcus sp.]|nr:hypothetical protein [Ruminococcus sp.]